MKPEKQRVVIITLSVALATVVLAGGIYFLKIYVFDKMRKGKPTICKTDGCLKAAEYFKNTMNLSADPCNDFFNFACGGWVKKNSYNLERYNLMSVDGVEEQKVQWELIELLSSDDVSSSTAVNQARSFFQMCVNKKRENEFKGIERVVKDFGGFPMYNERQYDKQIPWYVRLAKVMRSFGKMTQYPDIQQGIIFNFVIDSGKFYFLQPKSYYEFSKFKSDTYNRTVEESICNIFKKSCTENESRKISKQINEMIQFQRKIAQNVAENVGTEDIRLNVTIKEFYKRYPELHASEYLNELFKKNAFKFDDISKIFVHGLYFWGNVSQLINTTEPEVIDNFIGWSNFEVLKYTASPKITLKAYRYLNSDKEQDFGRDVKIQCFEMTEYSFPLSISRLYVEKSFNDSIKNTTATVVEHMKRALVELIEEKDWLSNKVKQEAINKIRIIGNSDIGYPSWLKTDVKLDQYYSLKEPLPNSSLIEMYRTMFSFQMNEKLATLNFPHYKDNAWTNVYPHTFNAAYKQKNNKIVLPATQIVPPLFWSDSTRAIRYGSIASTIGHEITHSIDSSGSQYDAYGNERNFWDDTSATAFKDKVKCVIDQFDAILDPQANMTLNGDNSKTENTADYGGWRTAYRAYLNSGTKDERLPGLEQLSDQKLFFVAAGMGSCGVCTKAGIQWQIRSDVHAPSYYRVIMPTANMAEFSNIFNCPVESKMNLNKKCVVW